MPPSGEVFSGTQGDVERRLNPAREMVFAPFKDGMMF